MPRHILLHGFGGVAAIAMLIGFSGPSLAKSSYDMPDIPANLTAPGDSVLLFQLDARGVQIYVCESKPDDANTYVWTFKAPEAELLNVQGVVVGHHFAGPTWQGLDGSSVVGSAVEHADAPNAESIPWLLLEAKDHAGTGAFSTVSYVQRLETDGGIAPVEGCDANHAGKETRQPYEATYAFYYAPTPAS